MITNCNLPPKCYCSREVKIHTLAMNPARAAALLALAYIFFCGLYIAVSTNLAALSSDSLNKLANIEKIKGFSFILITGAFFYYFSLRLLRNIAEKSDQLLEQRKALIMADRRAMAGSVAVSVAHDMNNQIMVMQVGLEEISRHPGIKKNEEFAYIQRAVADLSHLSRQLLNMGRKSMTIDFKPTNVRTVVTEVIDLVVRLPRTRGCHITTSVGYDLEYPLNGAVLSQMLFNLVLNAADATNGHGEVQIRAYVAGDKVIVEVHDNGPGIPKEKRSDVIKPFYTTKESGHGLGFISVSACAEIHSGAVEILDSDLGGCCVKVSLPIQSPTT